MQHSQPKRVHFSLRRHPHSRRYRSAPSESDDSSESSDDSDTDTSSSSDRSDSTTSTATSDVDDRDDVRSSEPAKPSAVTQRAVFLLFLLVAALVVILALRSFTDSSPFSESTDAESSLPSRISTASSAETTGSASATDSTASPSASNVKGFSSRDFPATFRGVNLGGLFILEPWMLPDSWKDIGCDEFGDEWSCNEANGMETMQPKWENHWNTLYNASDFEEMAELGLNSVRIPVGYWVVDSLIGDDLFASGSMLFLKQVLRWAKTAALAVVLDLHSVPGMGTNHESFTGHGVDEPLFFSDKNYQRAYDCLTNLTTMAHTDEDFANVVMIEVVNEPLQDPSTNLTSVFYRGAQKAIRAAEEKLGVTCTSNATQCLGIQFMGKAWGSGDPTKHINMTDRVFFDDHNYVQWILAETERTRDGYLEYACSNNRSTDVPGIVTGEWSLSTIGVEGLDDGFYKSFFERQAANFERGKGWFFWSWKTQLNSPQWGFQQAAAAGFVPDLSTLDADVCNDAP